VKLRASESRSETIGHESLRLEQAESQEVDVLVSSEKVEELKTLHGTVLNDLQSNAPPHIRNVEGNNCKYTAKLLFWLRF
jgi:hypothetical protein